jgi:hypothetical protein
MTTPHDHMSPKHLYARIREVLIADWDPMGFADAATPPDDYDDVAREVHAILTGPEASVQRIAAYLRWVEREQMQAAGTIRRACLCSRWEGWAARCKPAACSTTTRRATTTGSYAASIFRS